MPHHFYFSRPLAAISAPPWCGWRAAKGEPDDWRVARIREAIQAARKRTGRRYAVASLGDKTVERWRDICPAPALKVRDGIADSVTMRDSRSRRENGGQFVRESGENLKPLLFASRSVRRG